MEKFKQLKYTAQELLGLGNLEVVDSAFSEDYMAHAGDKIYSGQKFVMQFVTKLRTAIPNLKILRIELLSQADNRITWQRSFSGTHKAELNGIPASNKKVTWYEIVVSRFENDKIVEEWVVSDLAFQLMLKHKN